MDSGEVEPDVIVKIAYAVSVIQFEFKTFVHHLSYIDCGIVDTGGRCHDFFDKQVFCGVVIVVDATAQFVVEQSEVEADVFGIGGFPT